MRRRATFLPKFSHFRLHSVFFLCPILCHSYFVIDLPILVSGATNNSYIELRSIVYMVNNFRKRTLLCFSEITFLGKRILLCCNISKEKNYIHFVHSLNIFSIASFASSSKALNLQVIFKSCFA